MNTYYDEFETELGQFSAAVDETGAIVATSFGEFGPRSWKRDRAATKAAREQLQAYFAGERREFDLPLAAAGTPFQHRVWSALAQIPYGKTQSYRELAQAVGSPKAFRAVGSANGANPICVIIPCHRVISADGSLGGFGFGLPLKRQLLALEGAVTSDK